MSEQISDQTAKILVVDDTPTDAETLGDILRSAGYQVAVVEDGENALNQVETIQPDLILLDVMLPGMNGFEACRRLKENKATQDIPVIFSTALDDPADIVKGFEAGQQKHRPQRLLKTSSKYLLCAREVFSFSSITQVTDFLESLWWESVYVSKKVLTQRKQNVVVRRLTAPKQITASR